MNLYNWQQPDWPHFRYDLTDTHQILYIIAEKMGLIHGKLSQMTEQLQAETMLNLMVEEAVKTSEIEGEFISRPDIRSSIKNKLGLQENTAHIHDKRARGVAELMLDVRNTFQNKLTEEKLFDWHLMLLVSSPNSNLSIGCWRSHDEPMQIVSGHYGHWTVHFEAPPSQNVPKEMQQFIQWFNDTAPNGPQTIPFAPIRAAIAHLYFESIHPFEDGNGRIGRAIAEKALSQSLGYPVMLSLSQAIEADKKAYYTALNLASKSNNITAWLQYFMRTLLAAQIFVEQQVQFTLKKSAYFDKFEQHFNERQLKVIQKMLQNGPKPFEGGMSAKKYMAITGISKATATRDLQDLLALGAVYQTGEGRSVRYELAIPQHSDEQN